jgi:hypothetical protein
MRVDVHQNEYLEPDRHEANAVITVTREEREDVVRLPSVVCIIDRAEPMKHLEPAL